MNALILGASGLVGHELLELLLVDKRFSKIDLLSRRELDVRDMKVTNHVVDFSNLYEIPVHHQVDTLFIAFGTTLKKAGSRKQQFQIDVNLPARVMQMAKNSGVRCCVLVSAIGVSKHSPFFYSRMKACLDDIAKECDFEKLIILKPSVLEGARNEKRKGEEISVMVGNILAKTGLFTEVKPILATDVAKSMIYSSIHFADGIHEISSGQMHRLAKKYTSEIK
jgi:uncharacterized protein YbjT (DUF2867 family)